MENKLNKLLRELNDEKLDEEGNETNLILDDFMVKDNDNVNDVVDWCYLI